MATRFIPNPAFRAEIQQEAPFRRGMAGVTVGVAESIKVAAEPFRDTGNFIGRVGVRRGHPTQVQTESHFSHILEWGSRNNAPQGNVRRGVIAAGWRYADTGPKQAD